MESGAQGEPTKKERRREERRMRGRREESEPPLTTPTTPTRIGSMKTSFVRLTFFNLRLPLVILVHSGIRLSSSLSLSLSPHHPFLHHHPFGGLATLLHPSILPHLHTLALFSATCQIFTNQRPLPSCLIVTHLFLDTYPHRNIPFPPFQYHNNDELWQLAVAPSLQVGILQCLDCSLVPLQIPGCRWHPTLPLQRAQEVSPR